MESTIFPDRNVTINMGARKYPDISLILFAEFFVHFDTNGVGLGDKFQRVGQGNVAQIQMIANLQFRNIQRALIGNIKWQSFEDNGVMLDKHLTAEINTLCHTGEYDRYIETAGLLKIDFTEIGMNQGVANRVCLNLAKKDMAIFVPVDFQGDDRIAAYDLKQLLHHYF